VSILLDTLAKRLDERWATLLTAPGLLFAAVAGIAAILGRETWTSWQTINFRVQRVIAWIDHGPVRAVLVIVLVGAVALAATTAVRWLAALVQRAWLAEPPFRVAVGARTWVRAQRWNRLDKKATDATTDTKRDRYLARRNAIGLAPPARPTWIGDCMAAADIRIRSEYGLELASAWPRLWLLLPDQVKAEVRTATDSWQRAAEQAAWGLLYLALGVWWWPALAIGACAYFTGWPQGRASIRALAALVEAVVDLHGRDLLIALDPTASTAGRLTPAAGIVITAQLRKGA
jgi:hypothetical protein